MCETAVGGVATKRRRIVVRTRKPSSSTILKEYFAKFGSEISGMFSDPEFVVDLQNIKNVRRSKSFPVDGSSMRFEYDVDLDDYMIRNINNLENQIKFEKLGLWIVYEKSSNILRVTIIG
jgi:hypothetical protein